MMLKELPNLSMPEYGIFLLDIVESIKEAVRHFFYQVMLSQFCCPKCHGNLEMIGNSLARCIQCGIEIDPTVEFQACNKCGEKLIKRTYHYHCSSCGTVAQSRFLFDERVFDKAYFCQTMKESRDRKRQKRAEIRELLKESKSDLLIHEDCLNLGEIAGLTEALDAMVFYPIPKEFLISMAKSEDFKLEHYKSHILQSLRETYEILFDDISPLIDNTRKDRVFRFITLIFMSQWGDVELIQCGDKVMVEKIEAHS